MDQQPKVSVIMPSLNVAPYIRECIESVVNQTLKDIEIICVDAGSTDGTLEVLEEYAAKDERVKLLHSDKKSYGYQMNMGMDAATGEYMGIVETDDYILPEMYEELYALAKEHDIDIIKADFKIFKEVNGNREYTYRELTPNKNLYKRVICPHDEKQVFYANNVTWAGIYSLSFLKRNNIRHHNTPGASYQDNGFWFQCFTQANRVFFIDCPYYMLRRDNPNSSISSKGKVFCMCEEYDFIRDFLRQKPSLEDDYKFLCARFRYDNYGFTLDRIAPEYKKDFLYRFSQDFRILDSRGELDESLWSAQRWSRLKSIINDSEEYYYLHYAKTEQTTANLQRNIAVLKKQLAVAQTENISIKKSRSYRIGRTLTWIPRMFRGMINCYKEHGFRYTWLRVIEHIRYDKESEAHGDFSNQKKDYSYYSKLQSKDYPKELALWFKEKTGKELDLENPKTYNEKIQWMKLYDVTPLKTKLADKYASREWVAKRIGSEYLVPLLGVWNSFDEIDFESLPDRFVLKANHGCGWNIIVKDKKSFDIQDAKKKFEKWMNTNFAFVYGLELQYMNIRPKIIAEAYLENGNDDLYDYKVFCFNGKAESIMFLSERKNGLKMAFFDLNWNRIPVSYTFPRNEEEIPKPQNLELLIELAEKLSKGFPHVRVDFYIMNDGSIKFGEMTFSSASGTCKWAPPEQDVIYGNMINLPSKKKIPKRSNSVL